MKAGFHNCAKATGKGNASWLSRLAILACALVLFGATAKAGTVKVFAEYIGTGSYASPSQTRQEAYAAFLEDNDIDFGVFYGPSSAGNFGFTHADYAKSASDKASGRAGFHIFVYKTARWRLLKQYNMSTASNKSSSANACVVEDKTTGEQFAVIMYTTPAFSSTAGGTPAGPIGTMRSNCKTDYPNARVLICTTLQYGLFSGSQLNAYLVSLGFTQARDGTSCGAIYAQNHESRSALSASSASWLDNAAEPAALATVTYSQQFTIAFEDWDGTSLGAAQTVYAGEDATPPVDPTREGYTFTGWSGSYQNVQANATLTAQYAINTYTVRFLDWDGSVLKSETVNHGSDATPPADPVRTGWRFTGWQGDYTGITAATDITATYVEATAVTHWVTFLDWDTTQLSRQEIVEGEDATPPADPDNRPGWHFTGWQGNYTAVAQDETVTAQYAINTYVVTFQDWDGAELKTETVEHGSDATPPANPARTGWHFTGWSGAYQNVQAATTITAQYEIDTFTVTFQYTNGVVIATQTVNYQSSATPPANPAPIEEYTVFYRWDGSYSSITEDTTVTAIFVPNVIEIGTGAEFAEYMASSLVSLSDVTFAFTNDISMSGVTYTQPSGDFNATLDGRGHTLTRLSLSKDKPNLIGTLKGTVRDLRIAGYTSPGNVGGTAVVASSSRGGTLSGVVLTNCTWSLPGATPGTSGFIYETLVNMTTITNCWLIDCKVIGNNATRGAQVIGGFVAKAAQLKMVDCHVVFSDTNVVSIGNGIPAAGAFIGQAAGGVTIERCSNNARVKVASSVATQAGGAGGFVGVATVSGSPTIRDCANFGTVESTVPAYPAGGFIGDAGSESDTFSLTVQSCFNYGAVSSPIAAGGLIGRYRGVVSTLSNNGNSGAVSSEAGFAGGLVGQICYNDANRTWRICNAMQAGAVSTMSGTAGLLVGCIEESDLAGLTLSVSNTWIAGSAAISDGGQAGILFGGRDITAENELTIVLGESKVLESNASLPHYYDRSNGPASLEEQPATFGADALTGWTIRNALNAYVSEHSGYTMWIQGNAFPELATFGTEHVSGFMMLIR